MESKKCGWCNQELNESSHNARMYCDNKCRKKFRRKYIRDYHRRTYSKYREKNLTRSRLWRVKHPVYMREWDNNHPQYQFDWKKRNRDHIRRYFKEYVKKLLRKNPDYFSKYKPYKNLSLILYNKLTEKCSIMNCGFDLTVDLHHIDKNKTNNNISNLIGLCPSHHQVIHRLNYRLLRIDNSWILAK